MGNQRSPYLHTNFGTQCLAVRLKDCAPPCSATSYTVGGRAAVNVTTAFPVLLPGYPRQLMKAFIHGLSLLQSVVCELDASALKGLVAVISDPCQSMDLPVKSPTMPNALGLLGPGSGRSGFVGLCRVGKPISPVPFAEGTSFVGK